MGVPSWFRCDRCMWWEGGLCYYDGVKEVEAGGRCRGWQCARCFDSWHANDYEGWLLNHNACHKVWKVGGGKGKE